MEEYFKMLKKRIKKANGTFEQLYPLWKNKNISIKTKIYILTAM
jgi:hypothetical protein